LQPDITISLVLNAPMNCRTVPDREMLKRLLRRAMVLGLGILTVWLIVFVFRFTDRRLPTVLALAVTYGWRPILSLPRIVRMSLKILLRKRVPRFTTTGDGLPGGHSGRSQ
jgi:hypothetical protein